jgi:DNA-binding MarR family transcriptional regulator
MPRGSLPDLVERIVLAGVGLTSRALTDATAGPELTFPQWRVLVVLGERRQGATLSEVATRVGVTLPATSRQLRRLARRGLVEIVPDPDDRRASRARLTEAGVRVRQAIMDYRRDHIRALTRSMTVSPSSLADLARVAGALDDFR